MTDEEMKSLQRDILIDIGYWNPGHWEIAAWANLMRKTPMYVREGDFPFMIRVKELNLDNVRRLLSRFTLQSEWSYRLVSDPEYDVLTDMEFLFSTEQDYIAFKLTMS